jgi:Zn-dependent protease
MVMYTFRDYISKFRHYFRFSKEEIEACVISVLAMAFIISFNEWGYGSQFDFSIGLGNYIKAVIIMGAVLLIQLVTTKLMALYWGFRAEYKLWWYGILFGLGLAFLSGSFTNTLGKATIIWFLASGGIFFHHLAKHRLGWFRYGVNTWETALCCMMGSLSSILLAIFVKIILYVIPGSLFFQKLLSVSLWFALFTILPIPPLNGSRLFFASRVTYFYILGLIVAFNILLRTILGLFWIILISILFGGLTWAWSLWKVEKIAK